MSEARRPNVNLTLYIFPKQHDVEIFAAVAQRMSRIAPGVKVNLCSTASPVAMLLASLQSIWRPTLSIELGRVKYFPCLRGARLRHRSSGGKLRQYARLAAAGLPVPRAVAIEPETVLEPADWGRYVVVKPDRGRRGAFVTVRRTGRVRYEDPEALAADHLARRGGMIAQQFVYTGPWPISYRVLSYFGEPLLCLRYEGRQDLPPLAGEDQFGKAGGSSIVASATGNTVSFCGDEDVLALARETHAVTPDIPTLGIDLVRDARTGQLFVLETNPSGNSWAFGGATASKIQSDNALDFQSQFDLVNVMARRSADLALRLAR